MLNIQPLEFEADVTGAFDDARIDRKAVIVITEVIEAITDLFA